MKILETHSSLARKRAIEIGTAGEYLVCADLLLQGFRAFPSSAGFPYNVVVDVSGRLVRISVVSKLRAGPRPAREASRICYQFNVVRSRRLSSGKTDAWPYTPDDTDVVALVALDLKVIAYVPVSDCRTAMHLDVPGQLDGGRKRFEDYPFMGAIHP